MSASTVRETVCARLVSFHLAAADLKAAAIVTAIVGLAVHVVQALAAYQRGEEGLVNRQAHRVTVWIALLRAAWAGM